MKISVSYFAILQDERKLASETLETSALTPADLYEELKRDHNFSLNQSRLQVAVNDDFVDWTLNLKDGDRVVFIPPVAGG